MEHSRFSRWRFVTGVALATLLASCGTIKREFAGDEISASNDVLKVSVNRLQFKPDKNLRLWLRMENLTDETLEIGYGDMIVDDGTRRAPGAARVPFVRVESRFPIGPRGVKETGTIEFLDITKVPDADLTIGNIRILGGDGEPSSLTLTVPLADAGS